ncbi:hypothetical protein [Streptomyces sp. SID13726]|uniref:hypothetical protein n=1 Tax=Streptomyces sp. SID13726 TaxID=2706058 RepID=UPI001944C611
MSELPGVAVLGAGHMGADHIRRLDRVVSGARVDDTLRGQVTGPASGTATRPPRSPRPAYGP